DTQGNNLRRLTNSPRWDGSPVWSLDQRHIYFYSFRDRQYRIWMMDSDGSSPRALTPNTELALSPTPMPDGRVAYCVRIGPEESAQWRIKSIKSDGTDERLESDESNNYLQPFFNARTGTMICHGTGPLQSDVPEGSVFPNRMYLGPGPLLLTGFPRRESF